MTFLKRLSQAILKIQSQVILSIIYFVILSLFALLFKRKKRLNWTGWKRWEMGAENLQDLKSQF